MSATIIDGKAIAAQIRADLQQPVMQCERKLHRHIGLAVVLVGDDPASHTYVKYKVAACDQLGIKTFVHYLPHASPHKTVANLVRQLNLDATIDGILVQLPLPDHLVASDIISLIDYRKDVDGLTDTHVARLVKGQDCIAACTPCGIMHLLRSTGAAIEGKHAVVVGRSRIVGKPIAAMLLNRNATVSVCHSQTQHLASITSMADILVVASGRKHLITDKHVKRGAIVIDVGINRQDNKLYGDVQYDKVIDVAGYITPVPGGVGPMTIAYLLSNLVQCANSK
jgi:methylenetetrahydrofolate dehydrogenase (NADP+)/methenyltetrahydrofolate cyclohydrolase